MNDAGYRTGRRVGNTLYLDGVFIGSCITPEVAAELVEAANRGRPAGGPVRFERPPITAKNVKLDDRIRFENEAEPRTVSSVRLLPDGDVEVGFSGDPTPVRLRPDDEITLLTPADAAN